jgi:hypothetical protein
MMADTSGDCCDKEPSPCPLDPSGLYSQDEIPVGEKTQASTEGDDHDVNLNGGEISPDPEANAAEVTPFSTHSLSEKVSRHVGY